MSINKEPELKDDFLIQYIRMIAELYEGEKFLSEKILSKKVSKKEIFILFEKNWFNKWKNIVGYQIIGEKCFKCFKSNKDEEQKKLIIEMRDLFIKNNSMQKLKELGNMDCSNLKKMNKKVPEINEKSNFILVSSNFCNYFRKNINGLITINGEIFNGIICIYNPILRNDEKQKLILLNKENENDSDFKRFSISLEPKAKIEGVIKKLSKQNIDEIKKEYQIEEINIKNIEENK